MSAKKYQVFVSSTFRDLANERQDAIRTILDLGHIPAGMELFPAADVEQLAYIKKVIDECDYYLLIIAGRYGSLDEEGVSYTEREYDYAVQKAKFVIAFVHGHPDQISLKNSDIRPEAAAALEAFRDKVMKGRLVRTWTDRQQLDGIVARSLAIAFNQFPQVGWVRGDAVTSQEVLEQANKALQENALLKAEAATQKNFQSVPMEQLSGIDDKFTIRYRYRYIDRAGSTSYYTTEAELTWRDMFSAVASGLGVPRTDEIIQPSLKQLARDKGFERLIYDISSIEISRIKVHLAALRLIDLKVMKTSAGGSAEFMFLTPLGQSTFTESMVVRKQQAIPK